MEQLLQIIYTTFIEFFWKCTVGNYDLISYAVLRGNKLEKKIFLWTVQTLTLKPDSK
jgi:hypothetical protein